MNREQLEEELTCTCGAGHGSMEGHMPWCDWTESNVAVEPTMTREQKLEQELKPCPFCGSGEVSSEGTVDNVMFCGNCGAFGPHPAYDEATWNTRAALSAPKAEAVIAERDHYKSGLQILADTFYKGDQHQEYAKHVLDTAPIASPVPALTDEAVERAMEAYHCGMVKEQSDRTANGVVFRYKPKAAMRAALLAALPIKGGE